MFVIMNSSPIFMSVLAFVILGEPIVRREIVAILICFSAVILIALGKPDSQESSQFYKSIWMFQLGVMAISFTAFAMSLVAVITRKMKTVSPTVILFWYSTFGILSMGLIVLVRDLVTSDPEHKTILDYTFTGYMITLLACFFNAIA